MSKTALQNEVKMEIKTKTELLKMSKSDLEIEENIAWDYFKKIKAIMEFNKLED